MIAERCMVCHGWDKGGPTMIGPNLYGVVGRPKAMEAGFDYSPALREKGGNWTYEDLFVFFQQPGVYAPGTKMAFAGLPRTQDRLNLIAFLRMQADAPARAAGVERSACAVSSVSAVIDAPHPKRLALLRRFDLPARGKVNRWRTPVVGVRGA